MSHRLLPPRRRRLIAWMCAVVWLLAFAATHIPGPDLPPLHASDTSLHVVGYAGLASVFWITLWAYRQSAGRRIILCLVLLIAYGVFDELTQPYFHRSADILDWKNDCIGTALAVAFWECLALLGRLFRRAK